MPTSALYVDHIQRRSMKKMQPPLPVKLETVHPSKSLPHSFLGAPQQTSQVQGQGQGQGSLDAPKDPETSQDAPKQYTGMFAEHCVWISNTEDMGWLYRNGFFGKGYLSKSVPEYEKQTKKTAQGGKAPLNSRQRRTDRKAARMQKRDRKRKRTDGPAGDPADARTDGAAATTTATAASVGEMPATGSMHQTSHQPTTAVAQASGHTARADGTAGNAQTSANAGKAKGVETKNVISSEYDCDSAEGHGPNTQSKGAAVPVSQSSTNIVHTVGLVARRIDGQVKIFDTETGEPVLANEIGAHQAQQRKRRKLQHGGNEDGNGMSQEDRNGLLHAVLPGA